MSKPVVLFLLGLLVNILYLFIAVFTDSSLADYWQRDNGELTEIISSFRVNSESYIQPADNFLEKGVFGKGLEPDYYRTIGYPSFIAFFKFFLGSYWYFGLVIMQTIIAAFIYPIIYGISKIYLPNRPKIAWFSTLLLMAFGGYFSQIMYVMTDLAYSFFFLLGIYLSLLSTIRFKPMMLLPSFLAFAVCGLIRPTLILFPIAYLFSQIYIAKHYDIWNNGRVRNTIWGSFFLLIIICNLSSIRTLYHYNTISPSTVLGINMFDYTVKEVLLSENQERQFDTLNKSIEAEKNWIKKDKLKKKYFFEIISQYPVASLSYWFSVVNGHMLFPHYSEIGSIYGLAKKTRPKHNLQRSSFMVFIHYTFWLVNLILFISFLLSLWSAFKDSQEEHGKLLIFSLVLMIGFLIGPSYLAPAGTRIRLAIDPFIIIFGLNYILNKSKILMKTRVA